MELEKLVEVAHKVKGGDTWVLLKNNLVYPSLTEVLNACYLTSPEPKPSAFRLEPLKGVCYIIATEYMNTNQSEVKKYNIYGEQE
jgi:hypothetical protein